MGSHTIDLVWNAIDADLPTTAVAEGDPYNPDVTPVKMKATFDNPANDWRGPIKVHWYQGGAMPRSPKGYIDLNKIGHGAMFKGTKGFIICDFDSRIVLPFGDDADFTYYNNACKGDLKTHCDFDYAGTVIEQMLLGLVAYRVGKKIEYDGKAGRVTNCPEANALLSKKYRPGWTLHG
jgi:hypothetical protein